MSSRVSELRTVIGKSQQRYHGSDQVEGMDNSHMCCGTHMTAMTHTRTHKYPPHISYIQKHSEE